MRPLARTAIVTTVDCTYLVECYWPDVTQAALIDGAARAAVAAQELQAAGHRVEFLGGLLIPGDEVSFWRFASESQAGVEEVTLRAGLTVNRVMECIEFIGEQRLK
jgi:hypothetical protein